MKAISNGNNLIEGGHNEQENELEQGMVLYQE